MQQVSDERKKEPRLRVCWRRFERGKVPGSRLRLETVDLYTVCFEVDGKGRGPTCKCVE